jgi:type VI secretion system protein ImpJ
MARPLFWHQGLFLQPQHLQLADLHMQSLMTPVYRYLCPHPWGVGEAEIQTAALNNRSFNLLSGNFIFPDMTYVSVPDNGIIEARSFDEAWVEGGRPFAVYIGIKKWNDSGENVTVSSHLSNLGNVNTRFVTVQRLYHLVKIFWETEKDQLGEYDLIQVAQLERIGEGVALSEKFIPPVITVKSSDLLLRLILDIRNQIESRGRQLESFKRERGIHTAEFSARDTVYLLALRSLNRYIPFLEHILGASHAHPWNVYGTLRQIVGELSAFSEKFNVLGEVTFRVFGKVQCPGRGDGRQPECSGL